MRPFRLATTLSLSLFILSVTAVDYWYEEGGSGTSPCTSSTAPCAVMSTADFPYPNDATPVVVHISGKVTVDGDIDIAGKSTTIMGTSVENDVIDFGGQHSMGVSSFEAALTIESVGFQNGLNINATRIAQDEGEFMSNEGRSMGGCLYVRATNADIAIALASFTGCEIAGPDSYGGGALHVGPADSITISDVSFIGNKAPDGEMNEDGYGGAIFVAGDVTTVSVINCVFDSNRAEWGSSIGFVGDDTDLVRRPTLYISDSIMQNEYGTLSGPVASISGGTVSIRGLVFRNNEQRWAGAEDEAVGGAIYVAVFSSVYYNESAILSNIEVTGCKFHRDAITLRGNGNFTLSGCFDIHDNVATVDDPVLPVAAIMVDLESNVDLSGLVGSFIAPPKHDGDRASTIISGWGIDTEASELLILDEEIDCGEAGVLESGGVCLCPHTGETSEQIFGGFSCSCPSGSGDCVVDFGFTCAGDDDEDEDGWSLLVWAGFVVGAVGLLVGVGLIALRVRGGDTPLLKSSSGSGKSKARSGSKAGNNKGGSKAKSGSGKARSGSKVKKGEKSRRK